MQISDTNFDTEVAAHPGIVLVDFWASWCPPCKMMAPMVERLARECQDQAKIVTVNIDQNSATASRFLIASVPTFVVFRNGQEVLRRSGAQTEGQLLRMLKFSKAERQAA